MKWFLLTKYLKHRKLWGLYFRFAWNKNKVNIHKKATKNGVHWKKSTSQTHPSCLICRWCLGWIFWIVNMFHSVWPHRGLCLRTDNVEIRPSKHWEQPTVVVSIDSVVKCLFGDYWSICSCGIVLWAYLKSYSLLWLATSDHLTSKQEIIIPFWLSVLIQIFAFTTHGLGYYYLHTWHYGLPITPVIREILHWTGCNLTLKNKKYSMCVQTEF